MLCLLSFLLSFSMISNASEPPTLNEIESSTAAPLKIQATGKRESLEPKINGQINGKARYYHPNGQLYGVIQWENGKKVGTHILFREDGTFEQMLHYESGEPNGNLVWGNPDGTLKEYAVYNHGKVVPLYENGQPRGTAPCKGSIAFALLQDLPHPEDMVIEACIWTGKFDVPKPSFECKKANSEAEKHICSQNRLADLDRRIHEIYTSATAALHGEDLTSLKSEQRQWIAKRDNCFKDYRQKGDCTMRERIEQLSVTLDKASRPKGPKDEAIRVAGTMSGLYCTYGSYAPMAPNDDGSVQDDVKTTDHLNIKKSNDPTTIEFDIEQVGANGHSCSVSGKATYRGENAFEYVGGEPESLCHLVLRKMDDSISIEDEGNCHQFCGMRAGLGGRFGFSSRVAADLTECPPPSESSAAASPRLPKKKRKKPSS